MIDDAYDFWFQNLGRFLPAERDPLMSTYPHQDPTKPATRMGGPNNLATFLVSENFSIFRSIIRRPENLPEHIETGPCLAGLAFKRFIVDLIINPIETPFLFSTIGASRADMDAWRVTIDTEAIRLGGNSVAFKATGQKGVSSLICARSAMLDGIDWIHSGGRIEDLRKYRDIRSRHVFGLIDAQGARRELGRLKTEISVLNAWPGPDPDFLVDLVSIAARDIAAVTDTTATAELEMAC